MTSLDPRRMNPTVRGLAIVVLVAAAITATGRAGDVGLGFVFLALRIAFVVVLALVLFRLWRGNREEIGTWPTRSRLVFYGAGALALVDLGAAVFSASWPGSGLEALVFFFVLAACGFAMWRVWRDEHTYGY